MPRPSNVPPSRPVRGEHPVPVAAAATQASSPEAAPPAYDEEERAAAGPPAYDLGSFILDDEKKEKPARSDEEFDV